MLKITNKTLVRTLEVPSYSFKAMGVMHRSEFLNSILINL